MKIKVGDDEVLESGVVSAYDHATISFELEYGGEVISVDFKFTDELVKKVGDRLVDSMEVTTSDDGASAEMLFRGWNDPRGTATYAPLMMGTIGGRELKVLVRIFGMTNQSARMVNFTWLLGGKPNASR